MEDLIQIRLKVKEAEKMVVVDRNESIERFKAREFPNNRSRVIYKGKELLGHQTFAEVCCLCIRFHV